MFYVTKERQCTPWPQAHGRGDLSRPLSMYAGMQGGSQPHAADSFCGMRHAPERGRKNKPGVFHSLRPQDMGQ